MSWGCAPCARVLRARPCYASARARHFLSIATRAGFARNLFEVGGFEVVAGSGASSGAEAADELEASGAELAVICSSDALYAEHAADAARELHRAGARSIPSVWG